jgi:hypothetical protein
MSESEIENEINARVEFKMNELLTGVKNRVAFKYNQALQDSNIVNACIWRAYSELSEMVKKEVQMGTHSNRMHDDKKRKAKDKAVDKLVETLDLKTINSRYYSRINTIVSIIEQAQNF